MPEGKRISDVDFIKMMKTSQEQERLGHLGRINHGMVMNHPPEGSGVSLDSLLQGHTIEEETSQVSATIPASDRQLLYIDVSLIDPNPLAPREVYTHEMILERAEALREQGQHDPIHVIPNQEAPGRYIICDGWTRVQACLAHKVLPALLAEVHTKLSLQDSAWFGYQQNEERQQHCDLDRASFYEKLIAAGESASEIAKKAKLSKSMMSFYRSYAKLPEDVLEVIRQEPTKFGATAAYQLFKLYEACGIRKTISVATRFSDEDHPVRWLVNQVQAHLNTGEKKSATASKNVRYSNGFFKKKGDIFEVSIQVAPEKQAAFAQALEALLDTVAIQHQDALPFDGKAEQ